MKKSSLTLLLSLVALVAIIGSAAAAESRTAYQTLLSGEEAGTGSDAHGNAVFVFSDGGSQMSYQLVVNGLEDTTMAHIHVSNSPCSLTPPVLWLYPGSPPPQEIAGTFNGRLAGRTVTADNLFQPAAGSQGIHDLDDLRQAFDDGRAYVLVHTTNIPPGEICGLVD